MRAETWNHGIRLNSKSIGTIGMRMQAVAYRAATSGLGISTVPVGVFSHSTPGSSRHFNQVAINYEPRRLIQPFGRRLSVRLHQDLPSFDFSVLTPYFQSISANTEAKGLPNLSRARTARSFPGFHPAYGNSQTSQSPRTWWQEASGGSTDVFQSEEPTDRLPEVSLDARESPPATTHRPRAAGALCRCKGAPAVLARETVEL